MIVTPTVTLLAHTTITPAVADLMDLDPEASDAENLIEVAGRGCYESFHKPNPATRRNADYLRRTVFEQGHGSIAEHATATVRITGVSRALTHELVRHRHLSYSQLSQRFVNEDDANIVIPPAIRDKGALTPRLEGFAEAVQAIYSDSVDHLTEEDGLPRKQAREAARAVLPNMTETRIVVTGNFRTWAEVLTRRMAPDADAEFQEVAGLILDALTPIAPSYFGMVRHHINQENQ